MYIPDSIRLVLTERGGVRVYSADEGHEGEPAIHVAQVRLEWDELQGQSARVTFGTQLRRVGYATDETVSREYPNDRIRIALLAERQKDGEA